MNLMDRAKRDWKKIITNKTSGPGQDLVIITPLGVEYTIQGTHAKHHLAVDAEGNKVNSENANITFAEESIIAAGLVIRDATGEVNLREYLVRCTDSTGNEYTYMIYDWFPDERVGVIVCLLKNYES